MLNLMIELMERRVLPDPLVRFGIRKLCRERLRSLKNPSLEAVQEQAMRYREALRSSAVAVATTAANQQHYEVPAEFFAHVLGPHRKYSCAHWGPDCRTLEQAERAALSITMERAELQDGMRILELGCGWGSLTLAMAEKFPHSRILAISNSSSQKAFIDTQALERGLTNVQVITRDVNELEKLGQEWMGLDRVVSVEMFEHMKNYELLLQRIANWLRPSGKLFVHIFTHRQYSYPFDTDGADNWMGRYFFTGGQMPSQDLLAFFQKDLLLQRQWAWDGTHYQKTCEAWLQNIDREEKQVLALFANVYGPENAARWVQRWRVFFLACAELFGFAGGSEWGVSHYLFSRREGN